MYASVCNILVLLFKVNPNNYNKFGKKTRIPPTPNKMLIIFP